METVVREFQHFLNPTEKIRGRALTPGDTLEAHHVIDHPKTGKWQPIPAPSVGRLQPEGPNVATVVCPE